MNWILTLLISYSSIFVAWFYPHSKELFSILGAFFGTLIIVTIPGLMMCKYLYNKNKLKSLRGFLFLLWTIIFSLLGFVCGVQLVFGIFINN